MRYKTLIKLIGIFLFAFVLSRIDIGSSAGFLVSCDLQYALGAILLFNISALIKAFRWQVIMWHQRLDYPLGLAFKRYLIGLFVGTITPGRLGELTRAFYVKRDLNISLGSAFSSVVADRVFDLYFLMMVGLAAVSYFRFAGAWSLLFLAASFALLFFPFVLFHPQLGQRLTVFSLQRLSGFKMKRLDGQEVGRFLEGVHQVLCFKVFLRAMVLTVVAYSVFFLGGYLLTKSIGLIVTFHDATFALGLANSFSLLPITFAGVGTRDAMLVLSLSKVNVSSEAALALSVLVLLTSYFGTAVLGFLFFMLDRPAHDALND